MTLQALQETLRALFTTAEGRRSLVSHEALAEFLADAPLTDAEREDLQTQPLGRLRQYAFMLFSNVEETLRAIYPYAYHLLEQGWPELSRAFFQSSQNQSHRLSESVKAFPDYLATRQDLLATHPFLPDLTRYEWLESELLCRPDPVYPDDMAERFPDAPDALSQWVPVFTPVSCFVWFQHAVPQILAALDAQPKGPLHHELLMHNPTPVWMFRQARPYICRAFVLNPILGEWMDRAVAAQVAGQRITYAESLAPIYAGALAENPAMTRDTLDAQFLQIVSQMRDQGTLLGSLPAE